MATVKRLLAVESAALTCQHSAQRAFKEHTSKFATEETEAKPERTGEILSFLKEINRINPQTTHTAKNAQPVLPRSPLLQYSDPLGYSAEDIVKSELTGDNIDLPYFCCIPCPIL